MPQTESQTLSSYLTCPADPSQRLNSSSQQEKQQYPLKYSCRVFQIPLSAPCAWGRKQHPTLCPLESDLLFFFQNQVEHQQSSPSHPFGSLLPQNHSNWFLSVETLGSTADRPPSQLPTLFGAAGSHSWNKSQKKIKLQFRENSCYFK